MRLARHRGLQAYTALIVIMGCVTVLFPAAVLGWGEQGHVYVNRVAAEKVPDTMPAFMKAAAERIAYLGPEPDRWRDSSAYTLASAQAPDHFIDLERIAGLGDLPQSRYEFYRLLYEKRALTKGDPDDLLPERVGLQPYITIEVYERLRLAFRDYRRLKAANRPTVAVEQTAVFYAAWLGHYVADGSQPLHTTINYDGWTGNNPNGYATQHGIHRKFETNFVSRNITASDFAGLVGPPRRLQRPFEEYLGFLRESNSLVERVYQLEKAGGFDGEGSPAALKFTQERLAAGSQMLLNLWYTAWLESAE